MKQIRWVLVAVVFGLLVGCGNTTDADYLERAKDLFDKGQLKAASIELKNALQENQKNAEARRLLGVVHLRAGDPAGAEKELRRAGELGVAADAVQPLLARALLRQGKYDELDKLPIADLSGSSEKAEVLAAQGLGKLAGNSLDDAKKRIDQALGLAPKSSYVLVAQARLLAATKQKDKAYPILDEVLKQDQKYALAWALLGDLRRSDKQLAEAEAAYSKAIENRFANTKDYLARALVRIDEKKFEEAQKDIDILKQRIPKHPSVNYAQGLIHLHDNKLQEAKNAFEASLKVSSRQLLPKYYLALVNFRLGNVEQAEDYGEQAFAAVPGSISVRELLAVIKLKKGLFDKAEELVRPIVEQRKEDIRAVDLLASALLGQKKVDEALPLLEKVVEKQPKSALAEMRLGAALLAAKRADDGIAHIENALKKDPALHRARLLLVQYYLTQKQVDKAMQVAKAYREADPKSPVPWNLVGALDLRQADDQAAASAFEKALELEPGNVAAEHALAGMAIGKREYKKARGYYEDVLARHKDHLATLLKLALLDAVEKKESAMVEHLQQAVAAHPKAVQPNVMLGRYYLLKNQPGKVAPLMVELDDRQKNNPAVVEVMAFAQLAQKKYRDAQYGLKQLLKVRPKSPQLHFLMAKALGGEKDLAGMKRELRATLDLAPKHLAARLALARIALLEKDVPAAQAQLAELERIAPEHPDVLYLKGVIAGAEGDQETAAKLMEKVFEKAPNTKTMLAAARQKWAMGDPGEALALQEKWTREHPDDLLASLALAGTLTQQGDVDKALDTYETILQKDPKNVVALNDMAWYLRDKEPEKALEYAQRASELAPESASVLDTLAMVQLSNRQLEKAKRSIERALAKAPGKRAVVLHKAEILSAMGDKGQAVETLQKLLADKTDFRERKEAEALLQRLTAD